jgi:phosphosulfolactate synthase (CoM biosynthesis protein A)
VTQFIFDELYPPPIFPPKPRGRRQTWTKDYGPHAGSDGIGLHDLTEFLELAAERFDRVKFMHVQAIYAPRDWYMRKIALYARHGIAPYMDHQYFRHASRLGKIERAILGVRELGIASIELMNVPDEITPDRWRDIVRFAIENEVEPFYEFHPPRGREPLSPPRAASAEEIIRAAEPALEAGATCLLLDHLNVDLLAERAGDVFGRVVEQFGSERVIFEVETPTWREQLQVYLRLFGPDVNVANFVPWQALQVEALRQAAGQ